MCALLIFGGAETIPIGYVMFGAGIIGSMEFEQRFGFG